MSLEADVAVLKMMLDVQSCMNVLSACVLEKKWYAASAYVESLSVHLRALDDALSEAQGKPISIRHTIVPYVAPPMEDV